jgi:hypothetical protein
MRYVPIPKEITAEARRTLRDRFGHKLHVERNQGPCRSCLRISKEPEELILLSYQPLSDTNPYAEVGPIFIHARDCAPYDSSVFPADFADRELVVRAYGEDGRIADAAVAPAGQASAVAEQFLRQERVAEVHVRHRSYTCFAFKIVRD